MPAVTLALVLASAFLHALWNAAVKNDADPRAAAVAILAVAALASVVAVPFFPGRAFVGGEGIAWSIAAGLFEAAYFWTLALALVHAPLGVAYVAARGGALVALWPVSVLWLGERLTAAGAAGVALVCAGLAAAAVQGGRQAALRGVGWAAACALAIAGNQVCYKRAILAAALPPAASAVSLAVALPPSLALLGARGARSVATRLRARPGALGAAGAVCAASFLLYLVALGGAGAGAVATLRNTSVLFSQALARAIGERPTRLQLWGAALIVIGAVLLAWPG